VPEFIFIKPYFGRSIASLHLLVISYVNATRRGWWRWNTKVLSLGRLSENLESGERLSAALMESH
jgi:hypothetical protein